MLMNAPEKQITVTMTPRARIPKDHSSARVIKDTVEMESLAQVCFFFIYKGKLYQVYFIWVLNNGTDK